MASQAKRVLGSPSKGYLLLPRNGLHLFYREDVWPRASGQRGQPPARGTVRAGPRLAANQRVATGTAHPLGSARSGPPVPTHPRDGIMRRTLLSLLALLPTLPAFAAPPG